MLAIDTILTWYTVRESNPVLLVKSQECRLKHLRCVVHTEGVEPSLSPCKGGTLVRVVCLVSVRGIEPRPPGSRPGTLPLRYTKLEEGKGVEPSRFTVASLFSRQVRYH